MFVLSLDNFGVFFNEGSCSFLLWCAAQFCTHDCAPARQLWHAAWHPAAGGRVNHLSPALTDTLLCPVEAQVEAVLGLLTHFCASFQLWHPAHEVAAFPASWLAVHKFYSCTLTSLVSSSLEAFDWLHWYPSARLNTIFKTDISQKHNSLCTQPVLWMHMRAWACYGLAAL